jgi:alpha-glucosidase
VAAGDPSPGAAGWAFPALFELPAGRWVLLTEAAVDGTYCGCRLAQKSPDGVYGIRFPDAAEGNGQGAVEPTSTLPWSTPWRVIMVADSPAGIVESTLVTDLNPPSRVEDISWIKPGRVAWSWWSDHDSPQDYGKMREFVDLAAEMGWEYFLVDANWTLMDHGNVRELARYARSKGVGLFLWYNSGGEHNVVTEKPRGSMKERAVRRFEFELLRKWGVKGCNLRCALRR